MGSVQPKPCVLAVDDDPTARAFLSGTLGGLPVSLQLASSCREFAELAGSVEPSLCLIDVELPDGDGFHLADTLLKNSGTPFVFLTVHARDGHRLRGLELGAVDYLAKPIHPRELALRVQNLLARLAHNRERRTAAVVARRFAGLRLDLSRRRLLGGDGRDLGLTASEFEALALLTARPRLVVTRQEIAERLGPQSAARHNARIVDILVWRLRRKLSREGAGLDEAIVTAPSRGYVFAEDVTAE